MTVWYNEHSNRIGLYQPWGYRHAMWTWQKKGTLTLYGMAIRLTGNFKSKGWIKIGDL